jgi:hypothetical protein
LGGGDGCLKVEEILLEARMGWMIGDTEIRYDRGRYQFTSI